MKYLSHYTEEAQTALYEQMGAFFAFSNEQLEAGKEKIGVTDNKELISLGAGLIVKKANKEQFIKRLHSIHEEGIKKDLEENGKHNIIMRELGNHEAQITNDVSNTVDALEGYGITKEEIIKVYNDEYFPMCVEKDYF